MEKLIWHTETRKVSELIPYERNPRKLTPKQEVDLTQSIEKFNLMSIPVIDLDNKIISGHQRLKILAILGRENEVIDTRVPNRKLTDEEFREANIRENKNQGDWDYEILKGFDKDLLKEVGFMDYELHFMDFQIVPEATEPAGDANIVQCESIVIVFKDKEVYEEIRARFGLKGNNRSIAYEDVKEFMK
jgi:hypothetical protein